MGGFNITKAVVSLPFDRVLFHPHRLRLVAELKDAKDSVPFMELRELLNLTVGNLASHLRALEKHGMVENKKEFVGRYPKTSYRLTLRGRKHFTKLKMWFYESFLEGD